MNVTRISERVVRVSDNRFVFSLTPITRVRASDILYRRRRERLPNGLLVPFHVPVFGASRLTRVRAEERESTFARCRKIIGPLNLTKILYREMIEFITMTSLMYRH